jgi:DUF1365 family protein
MTASAVYEGWVAHRRSGPVPHSFRYRVFMPLFDLDELPGLLDRVPLWSASHPAPARFRQADYLPGDEASLSERARDLVRARLGRRPAGPVRVLANPRYLGVGFNPVSFLFLHTPDGRVDSVIAEVTNTPWGDRTAYVLDAGAAQDGAVIARFPKQMHVSPFQPMDQTYEISVTGPGQRLAVAIRNLEAGREVFAASMTLSRSDLSRGRLLGLLVRYPPMTLATLARIYANALALKLRGATVHPRPEVRDNEQAVRIQELSGRRRRDRVAQSARLRGHHQPGGRSRDGRPRGTAPGQRGGDGGAGR